MGASATADAKPRVSKCECASTAQSASGSWSGPTHCWRATSPLTERSTLCTSQRLLATDGSASTRASAPRAGRAQRGERGGREVERRGRRRRGAVDEDLGRQLLEHERERQVDRGGRAARGAGVGVGVRATRVEQHDAAVALDAPDEVDAAALARRDRAQRGLATRGAAGAVGAHEHGVRLLVLGAPRLERRERRVAERELRDVVARAVALDDLLEHVAVPAAALVADRDERLSRRRGRARRG